MTRWIRHNPLLAVALTAILALGIGANTAVFSIVDAVLLRPLPYAQADRLVRVEEATSKRPNIGVTAAEYLEWRLRSDLFAGTAAYIRDMATVTGDGAPDQLWVVRTTGGAFSMLGVQARMGRTLTESDENAVVLSDSYWRSRFHADPHVLGRTLTIGEQVFTVVGVMAPEFEFPSADSEMWTPLRLNGQEKQWVSVAARLKDDVAASQVERAMEVVAHRLEKEQPQEKAGLRIDVLPWREAPAREHALTLLLILGSVGLVLLIACADVAGLLLTRALQRQREIAVRVALGAGFWRVARQLAGEGLTATILGTVAGIATARILLELLVRQLSTLPFALPHLRTVSVNYRVLAFNAALCLVLACLVSLAPVWAASKTDVQTTLRGGRTTTGRRGRTRLFSFLIATEAAFAFLLLSGSALMVRSLIRLQQADRGLHPDHVLTMRVPIGSRTAPRDRRYDTKPRQMAYYRELIDKIRQTPGVRSAAVVNNLPLSGSNTSVPVEVPGGPSMLVATRTISPEYFAVMGIPVVSGRVFTDADDGTASGVAVINEYLARQLFGDRDPVGQPMPGNPPGVAPTTIVGVVKDAAQTSYDQPAKGELYRPYQQFIFGVFLSTVVVRTSGDPLMLADVLRREIWSVDASQPVVRVETMDTVIERSIWRPRFSAWIFSVLGGLALLLTLAGVYSIVAYTTTLRAHEVGVRVALGAVPREIVTLLLRDSLIPLGAGLAIGVAGALLLARLMGSLLYETSAWDPLSYLGAGVLLLITGAMASAGPAWRAASGDPLVVLRAE